MSRFTRIARALPVALVTVSTALVSPTALHAQSPVAGKWVAEFELGLRNENGVISSTGTGKARVTLEARGDSVFGSFQIVEPAQFASQPARALKGVFANGTLRMETEPSERRLRMNDEERIIKMISRYEMKLEGDALTGTTQNVAIGTELEPQPARPFKATRDKS